jgi:hypothetical protein
MTVRGGLVDRPDVCFLGARREPSKLQVFEHALAEWRHDVPFPGGWHRRQEGAS